MAIVAVTLRKVKAVGENYLTIAQFREELAARGLHFHERTIRQWVLTGRVKAIKPGKRQYFIPREELDRVTRSLDENKTALAVAVC